MEARAGSNGGRDSRDTKIALIGNVCPSVTMDVAPVGTRPAGTVFTFTALASCNGGTPQYRFELRKANAITTYTVLQDWSTSPVLVWDSTGERSRLYEVTVYARSGTNPVAESEFQQLVQLGEVCAGLQATARRRLHDQSQRARQPDHLLRPRRCRAQSRNPSLVVTLNGMGRRALAAVLGSWLCAGGCGDDQADEGAVNPVERFGTNPACEEVHKLDISAPLERLDLLFVLDATPSLAPARAALAAALPSLVKVFTTGDLDGDGVRDAPVFTAVHAGVVTSDLGTGEVLVPGCTELGDAAVFRRTPVDAPEHCAALYPAFLSWTPDATATDTVVDMACLTRVGDVGCGYTQPLTAAVRALFDNAVGEGGEQFLHGSREPSVLGVLVLTDRDDCSADASDAHLIADAELDGDDPRRGLTPPARCVRDAEGLLEVQRLANDLKRAGNAGSDRVVFAAITGVPAELATRAALEEVDWTSDDELAALYAELLDDPRLQSTIDTDTGTLTESCRGPGGPATPPRRLVEVARAFGRRGLVQSLCQDDLGEALQAFARSLADAARPACLPRALTRGADGLVQDCDVVWQLPHGLESCHDVLGWEPAGITPSERLRCRLPQVPSDTLMMSAWYLDDTSAEAQLNCPEDTSGRIAFTPVVVPPAEVFVTLECGCE